MKQGHELRIAAIYENAFAAYCTAGDWFETINESECVGPETEPDEYLAETFEAFRGHLEDLT